jgi:hypothetical protein
MAIMPRSCAHVPPPNGSGELDKNSIGDAFNFTPIAEMFAPIAARNNGETRPNHIDIAMKIRQFRRCARRLIPKKTTKKCRFSSRRFDCNICTTYGLCVRKRYMAVVAALIPSGPNVGQGRGKMPVKP